MFAFTDTRGRIEAAFTDRHGGVGGGAFGSFDFGDRSGDIDRRDENVDILGYALARGAAPRTPNEDFDLPPGVKPPAMVLMRQVHGRDVHLVDRAWLDARPDVPTADALVTALPGVGLVVRAADCVPVLLADVERGLVGAAHAGRNGMVAGVVPETVRALRELGARDLVAWVGPHVCGRCYEVPDDMRRDVVAAIPAADAETSWGTPALDIGAGVVAQLEDAGADVLDVGRCTREDEDLYSYRREGAKSGRLAGVVWVRP
jgi:YfiH family protein